MYSHVPSDIPTNNNYISENNLKSQKNLNLINTWTKKKKMILNLKKTKNMIFNFTKKYQFATRMKLNYEIIETVTEIKLLGTIITNDLKWESVTSFITKKALKQMQLLTNAAKFTRKKSDLKIIYMTFIGPVLEQSAPVWHSSLIEENSKYFERVQNVLS